MLNAIMKAVVSARNPLRLPVLHLSWLLLFTLFNSAACTEENAAPDDCIKDAVTACVCAEGKPGQRTCLDNGIFGSCECWRGAEESQYPSGPGSTGANGEDQNGSGPAPETCGDGICNSAAGESCANCEADCACADGDVCVQNECCTPTTCAAGGFDCGSISDGCGGTLDCGECADDQTCGGGGPNICGDGPCDPITDCNELAGQCGELSDGCGEFITCTCPTGDVCISNTCCTPTTCAAAGVECGSTSDGCNGMLDCGGCTLEFGNEFCNNGTCSCLADTCTGLAAECGTILDGCGDTVGCGGCPRGETCGATMANVCGEGQCVPETCISLGVECGTFSDGCADELNCGGCAQGFTCNVQGQCESTGDPDALEACVQMYEPNTPGECNCMIDVCVNSSIDLSTALCGGDNLCWGSLRSGITDLGCDELLQIAECNALLGGSDSEPVTLAAPEYWFQAYCDNFQYCPQVGEALSLDSGGILEYCSCMGFGGS